MDASSRSNAPLINTPPMKINKKAIINAIRASVKAVRLEYYEIAKDSVIHKGKDYIIDRIVQILKIRYFNLVVLAIFLLLPLAGVPLSFSMSTIALYAAIMFIPSLAISKIAQYLTRSLIPELGSHFMEGLTYSLLELAAYSLIMYSLVSLAAPALLLSLSATMVVRAVGGVLRAIHPIDKNLRKFLDRQSDTFKSWLTPGMISLIGYAVFAGALLLTQYIGPSALFGFDPQLLPIIPAMAYSSALGCIWFAYDMLVFGSRFAREAARENSICNAKADEIYNICIHDRIIQDKKDFNIEGVARVVVNRSEIFERKRVLRGDQLQTLDSSSNTTEFRAKCVSNALKKALGLTDIGSSLSVNSDQQSMGVKRKP